MTVTGAWSSRAIWSCISVTVQLTLFNFQSQFSTAWNLLFADVLLITIPPFVMFIFFQRQIVSGMTAGAVKG